MDDPINCNKFWDAARVNIFGIGLCTEHTHDEHIHTVASRNAQLPITTQGLKERHRSQRRRIRQLPACLACLRLARLAWQVAGQPGCLHKREAVAGRVSRAQV